MASSAAAASLHVRGGTLRFKNLLIVIKQTAFEEYSQVRASVRPYDEARRGEAIDVGRSLLTWRLFWILASAPSVVAH
jgi:hypothetical protein